MTQLTPFNTTMDLESESDAPVKTLHEI